MATWEEQVRAAADRAALAAEAQAGTIPPTQAAAIAARHDHSDHRIFGYTNMTRSVDVTLKPDRKTIIVERRVIEHREPVYAWWFTCPWPECGDPMVAQYSCDTWTPEGLSFMRTWRDEHGLPNVVPHGGEAHAMF